MYILLSNEPEAIAGEVDAVGDVVQLVLVELPLRERLHEVGDPLLRVTVILQDRDSVKTDAISYQYTLETGPTEFYTAI